MKLFPIYEAIGLDYIFFYGIEVLFLSQVKGISDSNIVLASSLFSIFTMFVQIPICGLVNKIGKRKCLMYGNILRAISIVMIIFCPNFILFVLAKFIMSIAFAMTSISANPLLNASIPEINNKGKIFSKIYGKGYSKYCYICAITSILSAIIAYNFIEIEEYTNNKETITMKKNIENIKEGIKQIVKSKRLKPLLLMIGTIWGLLCLLSTYQTTLLKNMNISATYIGIIAALVQIITGIFSKKANDFNNKNSNKSLTKIALGITLGAVFVGITVIIGIPIYIQVLIITLIFCARHAYKGFFQILKCRYMGNFATDEIQTKIYACESIIASIMRALIAYIGSTILLFMDIKYATFTIGIMFTFICIIISLYMKNRVGIYKGDKNAEIPISEYL